LEDKDSDSDSGGTVVMSISANVMD